MLKKYLAVDVGGTFIKMALLDKDGNFDQITHQPTVDNFPDLITLLKKYLQDQPIIGMVFSLPGSVSNKAGTVRGLNAVPFICEGNFKLILQAAFPNILITIENDANCAILGEIWKGGFSDNGILVSVVVGTGIGGAVAIDHKILRGKDNLTGEFGYALNSNNNKILSRSSSTRAMIDQYNKYLATNFNTGDQIFNDYQQRRPIEVNDFLKTTIDPFVNFLFNVEYFLNPDYIVLGGGISSNQQYLNIIKERAQNKINQIEEYDHIPNIVASKLGNRANLIGSLYFALLLENNKK